MLCFGCILNSHGSLFNNQDKRGSSVIYIIRCTREYVKGFYIYLFLCFIYFLYSM